MSSTSMPGRSKSDRARRVSMKAAHRRDLPKAARPVSFAALAEEPIYQRFAREVCPGELAVDMARFGFETAADLAACRTVSGIKARLARSGTCVQGEEAEMRRLLKRARREALRSYRLMRHELAVQDPMNQALRHMPSRAPLDATDRTAPVQAYAKPSSLQSNQSPAAYLRYLYRVANGQGTAPALFSAEDNPFSLANRRPDLAELVLSHANLKREVPTIDLVNEVLRAGISDFDMNRQAYPVSLPYDHDVTTTRAAMAAFGGTRINDIAARTGRLGLGSFTAHRWAQDVAGLLGLLGAEDQAAAEGSTLTLISEDTEDPTRSPATLGGLYKAQSAEEACLIETLKSALGLDADGLAQLFGLYSVAQENGETVDQRDFATAFLANDAPITLQVTDAGKSVAMNCKALSAPDLRVINYLARLHHGTGVDFHDLNLLLALPGAAADVEAGDTSAHRPRRRVTGAGMRLLVSYPLYRDAFDLTAPGFAALFGEISPYRRADQTIAGEDAVPGLEPMEQSFMASLFQDAAPQLHRLVSAGTTPIQDDALRMILARGFGLSALELDAVVEALEDGFALSDGVDARGLGALYRMVTLCRLLGWQILPGLTLIKQVSDGLGDEPTLWATLTGRNDTEAETDALCNGIDWLVDLAREMDEAEVSPETLLGLLTPASQGSAQVTDADIAWFEGVARAFAPAAVQVATFDDFETWAGRARVSAERWLAHLTREDPICDEAGVFLEDLTRQEIEAAVRACLLSQGVDPEQTTNAASMLALIDRLEALRDEQVQVIQAQVAALDVQISAVNVAPFLRWAQTKALDLLRTVLKGSGDDEALCRLAELRRHIAVVSTFELGDVEMSLLGDVPHWIAPELADAQGGPRPLDLAQLIWLHRFALLQVAPATDAALRGYLDLVNADIAAPDLTEDILAQWVAGSRETLALLLNCPPEDMHVYADALIGPGEVARDIAQIDLIAQHVRLAAEMNLSAKDLFALKQVSSSHASGDWSVAAAAAQAGLARFDDGSRMPDFRHRLAERERDALVAAFMQTRVAGHDDLERDVTDREKLYSYLLLDVNVTSAVPTSRMVEAISSLQLFISRALAGLEPGVSFIDADGIDHRDTLAAQWELDQEYRQWEANQKLMLYPQNYIEPELRQITSPGFDALLQAVSGGDITQDTVEAAVNSYMKDLAGACDLSVCSLYCERRLGNDGSEDTIYHMLAKAKWEPGRFFYRKLEADYRTIAELQDPSQFLKAMDWTYWQEVSIPKTFELLSDVTVCVFKNRYFFFWLELEERRAPVESPGQHQSLWRLHPRYMRCDQNALAGPMLTPGLFANGSAASLSIDGAFQWTGAKPVLTGTFHPTRAPDGLVYGQLNAADARETSTVETLTATFGIELYDAPAPDPDAAKAGPDPSHTTQLHIRLSEDWSDAILDLTGQRLPSLDESGPDGYTAIHPRPVTETAAVSEQVLHNALTGSLRGGYTPYLETIFDVVEVYNDYAPETLSSRMTFVPESACGTRLGSLDVEVDLGQRVFEFYAVWLDKVYKCQEQSGTIVSVALELEFTTAGQQHAPVTTEPQRRQTKLFSTTNPPLSSAGQVNDEVSVATVRHPTNETFVFRIPLHHAWTIGTDLEAELSVRAHIEREFAPISIDTNGGKDTPEPQEEKVSAHLDIGKIKLFLPYGKTNSAWTQMGEHGNRNFLHLVEDPRDDNRETFVVANSSSVLSKLAKTMPRPGGCESLFQLGNHLDQKEDYGTFLTAYPEALKRLYHEDETSLHPDRIPGEDFDFDSAYGAYGWEVFYHIPAAIAAGYASSGQFDQAMQWLRRIFDPQLEIPWRVKPLLDVVEPTDGLAFDTGDVIVDPDRIARDYPFYYQQATIRNMVEVLLDTGDAEYAQQTQESLQRAKALYVSAKQLFSDTLSETVESLTNTPWTDPTLGEAARDGYDGFLPPYNGELRGLYATIEGRLFNLRHWLDLDGQPLNVALLSQAIDPQALQRTAKARLRLSGGSAVDEAAFDSPLDFPYVVRSAKGYIGNLKLTSQRLQETSEKESNAQLQEFRLDAAAARSDRAVELQDFAVEAAAMELAIKSSAAAKTGVTFAAHLTRNLETKKRVFEQGRRTAITTLKEKKEIYKAAATNVSAALKATIPTTFGFSNGGQNLEQADLALINANIAVFLHTEAKRTDIKELEKRIDDSKNADRTTLELLAQMTIDGEEVAKASMVVAREKAIRNELRQQRESAEDLVAEWNNAFVGTSFYKPFREDLEALYAEEWATTQEFCRLLVRLYEDETQQTDGAKFLRTTSLGGEIEKFNAPHRLALDIERLEMAYIQAVVDKASETTELRFALSELPAVGSDRSALEELTTQGQVYFQLTDEMFDTFYPGQYDRRIQSVNIRFPSLAKAGLSPHARLTQVSNTRFLTPERDKAGGAKIRRDRHGLQSVVLGACEVDTRQIDAPDGLLRRFQNTGVDSCWHLVIPTVQELKRGKVARSRDWRSVAERHRETLRSNMTEVDFTVRFSGRWTDMSALQR
ncbi:MAG: neuraminidase-like domain-containing protein [Pseudomonadota bacterium]